MRPKRLLALVLASLVVSLAGAAALAQPEQQPSGTNGDGDLSPADRARRAKVVAKIGDVRITVGNVEDEINAQSPFLRSRYQDPARLRDFVDAMVRFELLAAEAERRDLDELSAVEQTRKQNAVQRMIRFDVEEPITPESIPDADVRRYYDTNDAEFHRPEMVRASHILLETRDDAVRLIGELATADARAFRAAAQQRSIDTETKLRGGDLRYFTRDGHGPNAQDPPVDTAIAAAAFSLREVGDVTREPVAIGNRFSILKLTGRRPAEDRTYEEVQMVIRQRLFRERRQQALDELVTSLRERVRPEVHEERMRPIELEPVDPAEGREGHGGGDEAEAGDETGEAERPRRPSTAPTAEP